MNGRLTSVPARLAARSILAAQSDERLAELARAGSEPAFEAIVSRYRLTLVKYCRGLMAEDRAEDVVQQAFVNAYMAFGRGERVLKLRPWLYRIAHNTALNALRDRSLRDDELSDQIDVRRGAGAALGPHRAAEVGQDVRRVLGAVQALPGHQRDAILLRELEGRSHDEIATQLGVTGGAVRQLLFRARTSLRAGMTVLTPVGPLVRLASTGGDGPVLARMAETATVGGTGAVAAKLATAAMLSGAVAGGAAPPVEHPADARDSQAGAATPAPTRRGAVRIAARTAPAVVRSVRAPVPAARRTSAPRRRTRAHRRTSDEGTAERHDGAGREARRDDQRDPAPHANDGASRGDGAPARAPAPQPGPAQGPQAGDAQRPARESADLRGAPGGPVPAVQRD
jgi:RNA polymerase sigma factor (sigma-70 family)